MDIYLSRLWRPEDPPLGSWFGVFWSIIPMQTNRKYKKPQTPSHWLLYSQLPQRLRSHWLMKTAASCYGNYTCRKREREEGGGKREGGVSVYKNPFSVHLQCFSPTCLTYRGLLCLTVCGSVRGREEWWKGEAGRPGG